MTFDASSSLIYVKVNSQRVNNLTQSSFSWARWSLLSLWLLKYDVVTTSLFLSKFTPKNCAMPVAMFHWFTWCNLLLLYKEQVLGITHVEKLSEGSLILQLPPWCALQLQTPMYSIVRGRVHNDGIVYHTTHHTPKMQIASYNAEFHFFSILGTVHVIAPTNCGGSFLRGGTVVCVHFWWITRHGGLCSQL